MSGLFFSLLYIPGNTLFILENVIYFFVFRIHWNQGIQLNVTTTTKFDIILHSKNDLPASDFIHSKFVIDSWSSQRVKIRNKHISKRSTRSRPCQKLWSKACEEVKRHEKIAEEYNCFVPIYFTGEHILKVTGNIRFSGELLPLY